MSNAPKVLVYDIETAPALADVWGLFNQNIGLAQLKETQRVICWSAQWIGEDETLFMSEYEHGHEAMIYGIHDLLAEADIVITYNGVRFDNPHLGAEFAKLGLTPPAPWKDVDLLQIVKRKFRFISNKLDHVAHQFLGERKVSNGGHDLWVRCLLEPTTAIEEQVKAEAWVLMEEYARYDTELTGELFLHLLELGWITGLPPAGLFDEDYDPSVLECPKLYCRSQNRKKDGWKYTNLGAYQRYQCKDCGTYYTDKKAARLANGRAA